MTTLPRFRTIMLVNPPADQGVAGVADGWAQPAGILCLGAALRRSGLDIELEILDGDILGLEVLESRLHADLVGLSCTIGNYRSALLAAAVAKQNGAFVVFGGPYASSLGELVLRKRPDVDALVVGYGEEPLVHLVAGIEPTRLPNTYTRVGDKIIRGPTKMFSRIEFLPDYTLLSLEEYWRNYQRAFACRPFHRPLTVPSQRGCPRRMSSAPCVFCAIIPAAWNAVAPEAFWQLVVRAEKEMGVDYVFETAEDFATSIGFLEHLARSRPRDSLVALDVSTRVDRLSTPVVSLLAALGVFEVFVGVESGSESGLIAISKGTHVKQSLEAASRLKAVGIRMCPGFIVGVPGETEKTLQCTLAHARQLREVGLVERSLGWHFTPLPGSRAFDMLLERPRMAAKYQNEDILLLETLTEDWANEMCHIDFQCLCEARNDLCN